MLRDEWRSEIQTNRISIVPRKSAAVNKAIVNLPKEINARNRNVMISNRMAVLDLVLNRTPKRNSTPTTTSTDRSSMPLNKLMISRDLTDRDGPFYSLRPVQCAGEGISAPVY